MSTDGLDQMVSAKLESIKVKSEEAMTNLHELSAMINEFTAEIYEDEALNSARSEYVRYYENLVDKIFDIQRAAENIDVQLVVDALNSQDEIYGENNGS